MKDEKRGLVSFFPEIDEKEESIGSHRSKAVDPSQSTASYRLENRKDQKRDGEKDFRQGERKGGFR